MLFCGGRWCNLREYVYSVVSFSFAFGLVMILAPDGVRQGIKKHIKLIGALCLVCILIDPVSELLDTLENVSSGNMSEITGGIAEGELYDKYDEIYQSYLDGSYGENIGEAVKDALLKKFDIKKENCRVLTEFHDKNGDGVREPKKITVVLSGADKFRDPEMIKGFLSSLFECNVVAAIE